MTWIGGSLDERTMTGKGGGSGEEAGRYRQDGERGWRAGSCRDTRWGCVCVCVFYVTFLCSTFYELVDANRFWYPLMRVAFLGSVREVVGQASRFLLV